MTRYHVSEDGQARVCKAQSAETCRAIGLGNDAPVHGEYDNADDAQRFAEKVNADWHAPEAVAERLKKGTELASYGGDNAFMMERYGTSADVTIKKFSKNNVAVDLHVYDGHDANMDQLIGDAVDEIKKRGFTGPRKTVSFKISAKYGAEYIDAFDEMDDDSQEDAGGKYGVEVGHEGLYAEVAVDDDDEL